MDHVDSNDDGQVNVVDGDDDGQGHVDDDDDGHGHDDDDDDGHGCVDGDDVYDEALQVDNLDPSQCFASTDTWSDPCQQKEPVCPWQPQNKTWKYSWFSFIDIFEF